MSQEDLDHVLLKKSHFTFQAAFIIENALFILETVLLVVEDTLKVRISVINKYFVGILRVININAALMFSGSYLPETIKLAEKKKNICF